MAWLGEGTEQLYSEYCTSHLESGSSHERWVGLLTLQNSCCVHGFPAQWKEEGVHRQSSSTAFDRQITCGIQSSIGKVIRNSYS